MDGRRGGIDKCNKSPACVGKWRIGQHVNLNPFRERRKHTGREQGIEWKREGCEIFVFLLSPLSPLCVISQLQAAVGKSLLITALISLGSSCSLFLFSFLFPSPHLLTVILPYSTFWTPPSLLDSSLTESSFADDSLHISAFQTVTHLD